MAYAKVRVLICDVCGTNQHTDDPAEAGGLTAGAWTLYSVTPDTTVRSTYVCTDCLAGHSASDLFATLLSKS